MLITNEVDQICACLHNDHDTKDESKKYLHNRYEPTKLLIQAVNQTRNQKTWTATDVNVLIQATLLHIKYFRRKLTLLKNTVELDKTHKKTISKILRQSKKQNELILVEILKGASVEEAFEKHYGYSMTKME